MATIATTYGTSATAGASANTGRSAAAGMTLSFCMNFTPSAIELGPAVEPAGVHRADPALHVRHLLVLHLARRAAAAS